MVGQMTVLVTSHDTSAAIANKLALSSFVAHSDAGLAASLQYFEGANVGLNANAGSNI